MLAEMTRLAEGEPDRSTPEGRRLHQLAALAEAHEDGAAAHRDDAERR